MSQSFRAELHGRYAFRHGFFLLFRPNGLRRAPITKHTPQQSPTTPSPLLRLVNLLLLLLLLLAHSTARQPRSPPVGNCSPPLPELPVALPIERPTAPPEFRHEGLFGLSLGFGLTRLLCGAFPASHRASRITRRTLAEGTAVCAFHLVGFRLGISRRE